ncbi:MAG: hypothetical protein VB086_03255 [Clostridiaceae bacterium]|nr:hypothetical protein [Clostridiaceae bacterium]
MYMLGKQDNAAEKPDGRHLSVLRRYVGTEDARQVLLRLIRSHIRIR